MCGVVVIVVVLLGFVVLVVVVVVAGEWCSAAFARPERDTGAARAAGRPRPCCSRLRSGAVLHAEGAAPRPAARHRLRSGGCIAVRRAPHYQETKKACPSACPQFARTGGRFTRAGPQAVRRGSAGSPAEPLRHRGWPGSEQQTPAVPPDPAVPQASDGWRPARRACGSRCHPLGLPSLLRTFQTGVGVYGRQTRTDMGTRGGVG